jgi:cytoskeletal protein RodZ
MRILTLTVLLGLPLMALGQTEPQQPTQEQTKETQTTAPTKGKKMRPDQEQQATKPQAKPETGTNVRGETKIKGRAPDVNKNEPGARSSTSTSTGTSQTNVGGTSQTTTVNKQEFRSRHSEIFSLGQHPKEFFVQRFGANHFRLIGNTYFVFVDGCWVSVNVDGFVYTERVICAGDPEFITIE